MIENASRCRECGEIEGSTAAFEAEAEISDGLIEALDALLCAIRRDVEHMVIRGDADHQARWNVAVRGSLEAVRQARSAAWRAARSPAPPAPGPGAARA